MDEIQVTVKWPEKLIQAFRKFPQKTLEYTKAAGQESSEVILNTRGLRRYPPLTPANLPPTPYYIRGRGTQYKNGNNRSSERLGTQWITTSRPFETIIGNRASYAPYVHGDRQAQAMARIGWKKLKDVATEKVKRITSIYNGWIKKLLKDLEL